LNEWNIPFINHVNSFGVIFNKKITWRLHIEMIEAEAFRTFIRVYSLFRNEHLHVCTNIKLTPHKALVRSVLTYAHPDLEFAAGNFERCTPVCNLHTAFNVPYVYGYTTELCRQQA
jgi:hypothetical protein